LVFLIAFYSTASAQINSLKINPDIVMPKDSLESKALLFSLNAFLASAQENSQNEWVLATEKIETQLLIDEIQDIQKSKELENDSFFKAYLTNVVPLENHKYAVHIAYIGINEHAAVLRANFELIAHKTKDIYLISSPLRRNTRNWKTQKILNHIYHYPDTLNFEKAEQFSKLASFYDEKLENKEGETHHYLCDNQTDPLKLFGVEYKSDYNGWELNSSWVSSIGKKDLWVENASDLYNFDTHDLWHHRLSKVISRREVHRRVDCHIAYLYGGSWGLSWEELFPLFSEKFVVGKQVDWLEHKKNSAHFLANGHKNYTDDFVGALLVKKIEKEKGFDGVWELLRSKRTKVDEAYFAALERLIGISKKNYNKEVFKLIEAEMNNLGIKYIAQ